MASSTGRKSEKDKATSRKRKRPDIPGFTSSTASTPAVTSQAPRGINASEFAEARALEISNMVEAIKEGDRTSGKRLFQTLPKHMRRRAMSHNVKRMPARLRYRASLEMNKPASRPGEVAKKKSRRYRRKPKNLLEEYTRRQRDHVWLETHIWHAKRMKMVDCWGYRLADHPNDKGYRAAYRAVKNNCILQDISFYSCIEVIGVQTKIIQAMSHLTSQQAGLTIGAKCYINGARQGNVMMYKFDQYPCGAISPVSFLWRQQTKTETSASSETVLQRQDDINGKGSEQQFSDANFEVLEGAKNSQLWVWAHPASFNLIFDAITEACSCVGVTSVERDSKFPEGAKTDSVEEPEKSNQEKSLQSVSVNGIGRSELEVISHRFDLLRFRLTGPKSHALLVNTLTLPASITQHDSPDKIKKDGSTSFCKEKGINSCSSQWWCKSLKSTGDSLAQAVLWERLRQASSPSVLPPGCVIGLTVLDPRLDLPVKKMSISSATDRSSPEGGFCVEDEVVDTPEMKEKQPSFEHLLAHWPTDVASSHVWDEKVRLEVKETKISEQELNQKRSELLVPGSQLKLSEDEISHIPLLLIQQPGCSGTSGDFGVGAGYGAGWDIILPTGWAMAFWIALVYRGARTGGLQESQTLALEQGVPFFPNDFPDTPVGEAYDTKLKDDGEAKYKRYPPAKRPNYEKLGSKSPFSPPWTQLVSDWSSCEEVSSGATVGAIRSISDTKSAEVDANQVVSCNSTQMDVTSVQDLSFPAISTESLRPTENSRSTEASAISSQSGEILDSIVQPFYVLRSRLKLSTLRRYAERYKQNQSGGTKHPKMVRKPTQSSDDLDLSSLLESDPNSLVCVLLRMLNRSVPVPNSAVAIPSVEDTSRLRKCRDFAGPLEPLHKGPKAQLAEKSLRKSCTREIVGFVSSGHYSLSRGCGSGIAFFALPGFMKLLLSSNGTGDLLVLVRGPSTQQYRFAHLTVL